MSKSSRRVIFLANARSDYEYWQRTNQKIFNKIDLLLRVARETPFEGIGKPKMLSGRLSGYKKCG